MDDGDKRLLDAIYAMPETQGKQCINCGATFGQASADELQRVKMDIEAGASMLRVIEINQGMLHIRDVEDGKESWFCVHCLKGGVPAA
jgi:hypothetical protein